MTTETLEYQCHLLQHDVACILEGTDDQALKSICKAIIFRFNTLKESLSTEA